MFRITLLLFGMLVLGAAGLGVAAWQHEASRPQNHEVLLIIPPGTVVQQANGQAEMMVPAQLTLTVGAHDTLVLRNLDTFAARVGPIVVPPGGTYRQRFRAAGVYDFTCTTLYHEEAFRVVVQERFDLWLLARNLVRGG